MAHLNIWQFLEGEISYPLSNVLANHRTGKKFASYKSNVKNNAENDVACCSRIYTDGKNKGDTAKIYLL